MPRDRISDRTISPVTVFLKTKTSLVCLMLLRVVGRGVGVAYRWVLFTLHLPLRITIPELTFENAPIFRQKKQHHAGAACQFALPQGD